MKSRRNDPCPCGSGRKYKQCCLAKDTAPSPDDLLWRRLRRDLDGLGSELFAESVRHFGHTGLEEAWDECNLWPETDESEDWEFDETSPDAPLFLSWYLYDWLPDTADTEVPERAWEITAAKAIRKYMSAISNVHIRDEIQRWVQGFHAALYCEPLPPDTGFGIETPFPVAIPTPKGPVTDRFRPQHLLFVRNIKQNRAARNLDRICCNNGKLA